MSGPEGTEKSYLEDPDTRLMLRFAAGDASAFERIVEDFERPVFGIINRYIGSHALAEDCAQEVFIRLYRMKDSYRPTARLSTLVYRITANLCLNALRDEARRRTVSLDDAWDEAHVPLSARVGGVQATPEAEIEARERAGIVRRALGTIPDRQRLALVLHRFQGLSYAEIAEALETNIDAVKALLSRARQSLADALKADIEAGNI